MPRTFSAPTWGVKSIGAVDQEGVVGEGPCTGIVERRGHFGEVVDEALDREAANGIVNEDLVELLEKADLAAVQELPAVLAAMHSGADDNGASEAAAKGPQERPGRRRRCAGC